MKSRENLYKNLRKILAQLTSYEKTRVKVEVDRILTTPYRDHRVELLFYSIRYNSLSKTIFVYEKGEKDINIDEHEYLTDSDTNIDGYSFKIKITTKINL